MPSVVGTDLGVERLGDREILCVTFGGASTYLFSTVAAPCTIPPVGCQEPQVSTSLPTRPCISNVAI